MKWNAKTLLPTAVLAAGVLGSLGLIAIRPTTTSTARAPRPPLLRVADIETRDVEVWIQAQGTVVPRSEANLVAEVAGRAVHVSAALASGGFFEAGDVLLEIDSADYALALERALAAVERATTELDLAALAQRRSAQLAERGAASPAALDNADGAQRIATAVLRDAEAARGQALHNLTRTRIVAPFSGRVREKLVGRGQFLTPGSVVARVYAVDYAEVRLPIRDEDAAFLDLPVRYRGENPSQSAGPAGKNAALAPRVLLKSRFAGRDHTWEGTIVRTEGAIDPRTRMIHAVARIEDPYGRSQPDRPPLAVGMFVLAEIQGRILKGVHPVPRSALSGPDQVTVVDSDNHVRIRSVEVLRSQGANVLVRGGILPGDRVPTSAFDKAINGMSVRVAAASQASGGPDSAPSPAP